MNDSLRLSRALALAEHRLSQPGVLRGRQRSPAFTAKVLRVIEFVLRRHMRAVRRMARLGAAHRMPFARRAVAALCAVASSALQRVILMMERIGLFVDRSALVRWGQTPQRSFVPRAKQVWHKASTFSIGPDFTAILADDDNADAAAFPFENPCQCDPYISGPVLKVEHYDCIKQPIEKTEESLSSEIRSALTSSILTDLDDDDRDEGYQRPMTRVVPIVPVVYRQPVPKPVVTVVRPTIPLPPLVLGDCRQLAPAPVASLARG